MEGRAARRRLRPVELGGATAYEGAAGIVAVSAAMRDDVLRSYPSVDPARVHVVHNGIDTTEWAPMPNPTASASSASTPTGRA